MVLSRYVVAADLGVRPFLICKKFGTKCFSILNVGFANDPEGANKFPKEFVSKTNRLLWADWQIRPYWLLFLIGNRHNHHSANNHR
ncbi:hypothetical protein [Frederiksenia canicola]|uniref:hypothetical protein n=1 Tax=Frederiksenia canicola TaxID=123824 RepID=UPI001404D315|nr:hypothetical protein [Frederiksenia canicola]